MVRAWVFARSLARRARVCIAGVGFALMELMLPACLVEEPVQAVRERRPAARMMVAAALVDLLLVLLVMLVIGGGVPCVTDVDFALIVLGSR